MSFLLNYQLSGLQPFSYHLVNLLLHLASTGLVYLLLPHLRVSKAQALFVSAVFAVHPIGIEVVTFVSGRSDALVSVCILLSLYAYCRRWFAISVVSLIAALLSKESAVIVPVLMLLMSWAFPKHRSGKHWATGGALFIACLAYAGYRVSGMQTGSGALSWIASASFTERLLTVPDSLLTYLRIIFWPHPLHMEYHTVITSWMHPSVWLGIPIVLLLTAALLLTPIINDKKQSTVFWLLWFLIGLAPVLNIIAPQTSTLREHWLYLPAIGVYVLVARLGIWQKANRDNLFVAALAVVTALGLLTYQRNRDWQHPMRLYAHDVALEPRSFILWNNLGTEYFQDGRIKAAEAAFRNAIKQSPGEQYGIAYNNLGVIVQNEGDYQRALELYLESIRLSQYELGYSNAIELLWQLGRREQARQLLEEAREVHPYSEAIQEIEE